MAPKRKISAAKAASCKVKAKPAAKPKAKAAAVPVVAGVAADDC